LSGAAGILRAADAKREARRRPSHVRTALLAELPAVGRATDNDEPLAGLSARNRLHGYVDEVRIDGLLAQVRLRVGDQRLTAVITADAVKMLKLRRGDDAIAVIKSTEVMIARAGERRVSKRPRAR
jgi:molybdopterin-binding protein